MVASAGMLFSWLGVDNSGLQKELGMESLVLVMESLRV
jgi:hypothetical protein